MSNTTERTLTLEDFRVGDVWRRRDGGLEAIVKIHPRTDYLDYPIRGHCGCWSELGYYDLYRGPSGCDLVELVSRGDVPVGVCVGETAPPPTIRWDTPPCTCPMYIDGIVHKKSCSEFKVPSEREMERHRLENVWGLKRDEPKTRAEINAIYLTERDQI